MLSILDGQKTDYRNITQDILKSPIGNSGIAPSLAYISSVASDNNYTTVLL